MKIALDQPLGRAWVLALALLLISGVTSLAVELTPIPGKLSGCVEMTDHPVYRGVASLWPAGQGKAPDPRRAIRPPVVAAPLQADGCFSLQTLPGEYFVGAIVRLTDGGWQGPPRPGDMVFLSPDATDQNVVVTIRPGETVNIGRHTAGWKYSGFDLTETSPAISGKLIGVDGKPLAGLLVFAFADSDMSKEPVAVSEPSDNHGRYLLRLPEPATVYLRAREHYGRRSPTEGGYMGIYGEGAAVPVAVGAGGDRQDRNLTVFLIPPLDARQKKMTELPSGPKNN